MQDEDKYLHTDKDLGIDPVSDYDHQASDCITQSSPALDGESRFVLFELINLYLSP